MTIPEQGGPMPEIKKEKGEYIKKKDIGEGNIALIKEEMAREKRAGEEKKALSESERRELATFRRAQDWREFVNRAAWLKRNGKDVDAVIKESDKVSIRSFMERGRYLDDKTVMDDVAYLGISMAKET